VLPQTAQHNASDQAAKRHDLWREAFLLLDCFSLFVYHRFSPLLSAVSHHLDEPPSSAAYGLRLLYVSTLGRPAGMVISLPNVFRSPPVDPSSLRSQ
jgi:hypothetical protein